MQTPPLPSGESGRNNDPAASTEKLSGKPPGGEDGPSTVVRLAAAKTDRGADSLAVEEDVLADLFGGDDAKISDESPTVISKTVRPLPVDEAVAEKVAAESLRGRRLAHFELLEPVGVGGMAAVIRARDTQLDRTVALKVLPPEMAEDPENVRRFHQEARSAAKLDHENIARVFYCGEDQRLHFIAFEFVEGDNLRSIIDRRGRISVQEALHYMMQIAAGLAHAAARGVVHRDIKPSNIIVSPNGRAKLVDMGLARMSETPSDHALTQSGVTLGTFDYISPEQALEPRDADLRSDIYSLGCTFYHALTGQPPAPDGTAARKLHHHQNEAPIDPRQLNPEIPDDVAMILARMMAKDPKARYQRAEHLVQHLHLASQRIGVPASELADQLPYLDAPLPEPPRTRPLLVAGLAAMILLVFVLFLGRADKQKDQRNGLDTSRFASSSQKESGSRTTDAGPKRSPTSDSAAPETIDTATEPRNAATARELLDLAQEKRGEDAALNIVLTGGSYEFPLARDDGIPLTPILTCRKVVLRGKDLAKKPSIRFAGDAQQPGQIGASINRLLGLAIDADEIVIENVRFVMDGRGSRFGGMAGLILTGRDRPGSEGSTITVKDCEFIQVGQPPELTANRPSSVVFNAANRRPRVTLENCLFLGFEEAVGDDFKNVKRGGQDAITLKTPAREIVATNCAFGPHYSMFRIEPGADGSDVKIRHCAGILFGESAAFHLVGEKTTCRLDVRHSWLAGLNAAETAGGPVRWRGTALLRQDGADNTAFRYVGRDNRLHHLDAFWVRPTAADRVVAEDQKEFQEKDMDEDSIVLPSNVRFWKTPDPLDALERGEIAAAFTVNDQLAQLRSIGDKALVGLTSWGKQVFKPAEDKPAVAGRKSLTVDPTARAAGNNTFPTLLGAIAEIKPEEEAEVLLKFDGFKELSPVRVESRIKAIIRPAPGSHPIVAIKSSRDQHSLLFHILDGELTLENLEFLVQPNAPLSDTGLKSLSLVGLVGEGRCTFSNCWLTLDPAGKRVPLAVVTVSDPEAHQMRMDNAPQSSKVPRIVFDSCVVRGEGDLVSSHAVRPYEAELSNLWTALSGSLLNSDGARDENSPPPEQAVQLRLRQVTAYMAGYLVRMRAGNLKHATPIRVDSAFCIFQSAGIKSLIHLEGPNPGEDMMKSLIQWSAEKNIYGEFENLQDNQPADDSMPAPSIGQREWPTRPGENSPQISRMQVLVPAGAVVLLQATPGQFKLRSNVAAGQGANPDTLPKPGGEPVPRIESKSD
jgi:serine/threonine protein kinase